MQREPLVPAGNQEYLKSTVMPLLHDALEELGSILVRERLQIATGELWDEDGYRPEAWGGPVDQLQFLADYFRRARFHRLSRLHVHTVHQLRSVCMNRMWVAQITKFKNAEGGTDRGAPLHGGAAAAVTSLARAEQGG